MKAVLRRTVTVAFAIAVLAVFSGNAFAAGSTVTYNGNADQFVFLPGADLFQNFKGVMPGDTLTQEITVKNDTVKGGKVKIYLRAEPAEEKYKHLLSQMSLKVVQDGQSVLFEAPADQQGGLASNVCLGTFSSGAEVRLNVTLVVPIAMDNEFQDQSGSIRWVFTAEEFPETPDNPQTSDPALLWMYIALSGIGASGLLTLILIGWKRAARRKTDRQASV
jgi:hypothetical protein